MDDPLTRTPGMKANYLNGILNAVTATHLQLPQIGVAMKVLSVYLFASSVAQNLKGLKVN